MSTKPVPAGCGQKRWTERRGGAQQEAASASSEFLTDEAVERRLRIRAWFWNLYAAVVLVAICAVIAHFLPALKTLAN
jgi:hypothetical protein